LDGVFSSRKEVQLFELANRADLEVVFQLADEREQEVGHRDAQIGLLLGGLTKVTPDCLVSLF
jgi:hypothetical protein